tara:strand:+ start:765 stop:1031 length:267 start_codon:yes stop_codon:yes gene_type:complete
MFILCLTGKPEKVFSVLGPDNFQVIPMFVDEEDAERYAYLVDEVNDFDLPELDVNEVDGESIMAACASQNTEFVVYDKDDLIIPPRIL